MKKLFIGLLIIAAGAGIFYLWELRNQNSPAPEPDTKIQKDLLVGNWKLNSINAGKDSGESVINLLLSHDSNLLKFNYEFTKDSALFVSVGDSLTGDTSSYKWSDQNHLVFLNKSSGIDPDSLRVAILTKDSLILQDRDSALLVFTKAR
ncbi:MAG: hypothetical protein ABIR18_06360 [Chitinophagaceae bacterium]